MDPETIFWVSVILGLIALGLFWGLLYAQRRYRLIKDTPTSKCRGVFVGLVELKGTAESESPLTSRLAKCKCVLYRWSIAERWSRTVQETYTDSNGKTRTRTRHESGWTTLESDSDMQSFYLRDDTGNVLVHPHQAECDGTTVFSERCGRGDPLYYSHGHPHAVSNSDHIRKFTETAIPLHSPLYLIGAAQERDDVVAPEIVKPKGHPFIISMKSEDDILGRYRFWYWLTLVLSGLFTIAWPIFLVANDEAPLWVPFAAGAAYSALVSISWLWCTFNHLVFLRNRIRQAASLMDVQYKRRHDLIPQLTASVRGLRDHEASVQNALAALRENKIDTPLSPHFKLLAEKYPDLIANTAFLELQESLIDTEDRIALAINYYNDSVTNGNTRIQSFPENLLSGMMGFHPFPLNTCRAFERDLPSVDFTR